MSMPSMISRLGIWTRCQTRCFGLSYDLHAVNAYTNHSIDMNHTQSPPGDVANSVAEKVVDVVVQRLQVLGHTVFLTADYVAQSPVPVLLDKGLSEEDIVELMVNQKEHWLSLKGKTLSRILHLLASFQISARNAVLILAKEPKIFELDNEYLINRLSALRRFFVVKSSDSKDANNSSFNKLLLKCPFLFFDEMERYAEAKSRLANFFSNKQIGYMLENYPWVLTLDPDRLELSFEYLHFVMGLDPFHIVKCQWYKHSLSKMHARFKFALKSGSYVKPHPKKPTLSKNNMELSKFLDSSDQHFVNMCNCSPEEFVAFCAMYAHEFEDIERIKDEIQRNAQFKIGVYKRYENRKSRDQDVEDDEEEKDEDFDEEEENRNSSIDDRPDLVNKQWSEKHRRGRRRR